MRYGYMRDPSCRDMVQCFMELNDFEMQVFTLLRKLGDAKVIEIADKLDHDRSTTYRALQQLVKCELATREKRELEGGGYYYAYSPISKAALERELRKCIDEANKNMKKALKKLDKM